MRLENDEILDLGESLLLLLLLLLHHPVLLDRLVVSRGRGQHSGAWRRCRHHWELEKVTRLLHRRGKSMHHGI